MGMGLCYNQLRKLEFGEVISLEQVIEYIKKKYNPLSIKNLNKIVAIIVAVEIRSRIYENIQLNATHERCIVELFVTIRNN